MEEKECGKENLRETKEEKKEEKEKESLLTKTILVEVEKDKCENKEEIALTAISSLKPFAGLT